LRRCFFIDIAGQAVICGRLVIQPPNEAFKR
jgi:hypothetical protein